MINKQKSEAVSEIIREQLLSDKYVTLEVISGSMIPLILPGDKVIVKCIPVEKIHMGDIILFKKNGYFCTHRFIGFVKNGHHLKLIAKGDNNMGFDIPFDAGQFLGKIERIEYIEKIDFTLIPNRYLNRLIGGANWIYWKIQISEKYFNQKFWAFGYRIFRKLYVHSLKLFYAAIYFKFIKKTYESNQRTKTDIPLHLSDTAKSGKY